MNKLKCLDDEEKELVESLENGEWVSVFDESVKKKYQEYAKFTSDLKQAQADRAKGKKKAYVDLDSI